MKVEKISISLPRDDAKFIDAYRKARSLKTRSEVVARAVALLRERELEKEYRSAAQGDKRHLREWDSTVADGLDDETW